MKKLNRKNIYRIYLSCLPVSMICKKTKKFMKKAGFEPVVIMYHSVTEGAPKNNCTVNVNTLESQLDFLVSNGFDFIFENQHTKTNTPAVVLSFDDGYVDNYNNLFPLLKKYKVKATVNLISDYISEEIEPNYLKADHIMEMQESGLVSFESHSCNHAKLTECTLSEVERQLKVSKETLHEKLGIDSSVFVYPYGLFNKEIAELAGQYYESCYIVGGTDLYNKYWLQRTSFGNHTDPKRLSMMLCISAKNNYDMIKKR